MTISDDALMTRGAEGDDEAFRILVQRWERPVFSFLVRMLGSREEAQDLSQETFLRLIRAAGKYRPTGQFQSWLFRIAGNLARSRLRRRKVIRWLSFDRLPGETADRSSDSLRELEDRERRREVRRAIAKLPERQREALILRQYRDMKYQEIARAMNVSTASVQMLLHRAMTTLRKDLGGKRGKRGE